MTMGADLSLSFFVIGVVVEATAAKSRKDFAKFLGEFVEHASKLAGLHAGRIARSQDVMVTRRQATRHQTCVLLRHPHRCLMNAARNPLGHCRVGQQRIATINRWRATDIVRQLVPADRAC